MLIRWVVIPSLDYEKNLSTYSNAYNVLYCTSTVPHGCQHLYTKRPHVLVKTKDRVSFKNTKVQYNIACNKERSRPETLQNSIPGTCA